MAKITLKEIAKLADVSVMTVSNVIHGKNAKVSIKTKEKILRLVEKYNYVPNQNASNLRTGSSQLIGVLFYSKESYTDFTDPFVSSILTGIENVANKYGYFTMIRSIDKAEDIEVLQRNWTFAGFIVIGVSSYDFSQVDKNIFVPVTYVDTYRKRITTNSEKARNFVGTDEDEVSKIAVDYLVEQGHENILFCSFDFDAAPSVIEKRFSAFKKYFAQKSSGQFLVATTPTPNYQDVLQSVKPYLMAQPFSAIYATADILAVKLNQIFKDISIIGVDNAEFCDFVSPKLTTIAIDQVEKGEIAMKKLIMSINQETSSDFYSNSYLIERDSVTKNS